MLDDLKSEDLLLGFLYAKPMSRSFPLCKPSDFRPHSSSDPFGATFPPGEGILPLPPQRFFYHFPGISTHLWMNCLGV